MHSIVLARKKEIKTAFSMTQGCVILVGTGWLPDESALQSHSMIFRGEKGLLVPFDLHTQRLDGKVTTSSCYCGSGVTYLHHEMQRSDGIVGIGCKTCNGNSGN